MFGKTQLSRWLTGAALLAAFTGIVVVDLTLTVPAQAQFRDNLFRQRAPRSGGFFDNLFAPPPAYEEPRQFQEDYSRAPSARKPDKDVPAPTTSILVLGDGMADWLAYGLEDAFSDTPEVGIIRRSKNHSGLLRYDPKSDLDWAHAARDILAKEKANYVVMMLGVNDRQTIRESDLAKEAEKKDAEQKKTKEQQDNKSEADKKKAKDQQDKNSADKNSADKNSADKSAQNKDSAPAKDAENPDQPSIIAPERPVKRVSGSVEFRTDQWAEIYARRIDETTAALKSKGVAVFWVGLPSIRGAKTNADMVYLNDLYRGRAERAGAIYVDVWDGFVDEAGKYTQIGPDFEGQTRKLRTSDGVYFTKYGARKLAHYVERELRRYMNNRVLPVALPTSPIAPAPADGKPAARPVAGPVVPLTVTPGNSDELLGGSSTNAERGDPNATRVLVKGEPVPASPGRADDFGWPRANNVNGGPPVAALSAAATAASASVTPDTKPAEPKSGAAGKTSQNAAEKSKTQRQSQDNAPRPVRRSTNPLGWLR